MQKGEQLSNQQIVVVVKETAGGHWESSLCCAVWIASMIEHHTQQA